MEEKATQGRAQGGGILTLAPEREFVEQVACGDLALVKVADGTQQRISCGSFCMSSPDASTMYS